MSTGNVDPVTAGPRKDPAVYVSSHFVVAGEELRRASRWLLFLGILLIALGTLALIAPGFATASLVVFYGWVLLIAGIGQALVAGASMRWGGFFLHLLLGLVDIVIGLFFLRHVELGAEVLTLLLIIGFLIGGMFRLVVAFALRFPNWGWTVLSGLITFAVGMFLWGNLPWVTLVVPGLFLGIQMLFAGWSAVMLSLAANR